MNEDDLEVLKLLEEYVSARETLFSGPDCTDCPTEILKREVAAARTKLLAKLGIPEVSDD